MRRSPRSPGRGAAARRAPGESRAPRASGGRGRVPRQRRILLSRPARSGRPPAGPAPRAPPPPPQTIERKVDGHTLVWASDPKPVSLEVTEHAERNVVRGGERLQFCQIIGRDHTHPARPPLAKER